MRTAAIAVAVLFLIGGATLVWLLLRRPSATAGTVQWVDPADLRSGPIRRERLATATRTPRTSSGD